MPSITPQKTETVENVRKQIARMTSAVLLDFRGLEVETVTALRAEFRKAGVEYKVAKNKLVKKALVGTKLEGNKELEKHLIGPTGIAFSFDDPSAAAKVVKAFRALGDKQEKLTVKCGLVETTFIPGSKVETDLATMPGKDEIRASLLATLQAPAQKLVMQLQAAGQRFAYVLSARERQLGEQ